MLPYIFLSSSVTLQFHAFSTVKANFLGCRVCFAVFSFLGVRSTMQCGNVAVAVTGVYVVMSHYCSNLLRHGRNYC